MFQVTELIGFMSASGGVVTKAFNAVVNDTADLSTYTFVGASLGTAAGDRKIVVTIHGRSTNPSTRTISSVTIAGVAATAAVSVSNTIGDRAAVYVADVPTGTTGDIVVVFNDTMQKCIVGSYAMYGAGSSTPTATATDIASTYSQSLTIPAGGVAFAIASVQASASTTWAGLTEDFDSNISSEVDSGASLQTATLQSGLTVSATFTAGSDGIMVMAAFGP